jgi:signal transduction histidine kinase
LNLDANITLIDQEGHIIYSNRFSYTKKVIDYPSFDFVKRAMKGEKGEVEIRDSSDGGRVKFVSFAPIEGIGWSIIVEKAKSEVLRSEYSYFISVATISFLIYVVVALTVVHLRERQRQIRGLEKLNQGLDVRVRERTAQLEAANKELEAFSYSVSHDLRAPLRAIDGFSRILLEDCGDKLDGEGKRFLSIIRSNTQKMGQLIDDLLVFLRLGRQEINLSEISMDKMAKSVFDELRATVPEKTLQLDIKTPPSAHGDRPMIRQVLVNLLSNAVKFTRPKETAMIEVGGLNEGDENVYYVKDNGVGFNMQYVDKLFGVFQRLHSASEFEGTGVGLAIVQRIIHRHSGRVWAEGKVGEGATFFFTLPRKDNR